MNVQLKAFGLSHGQAITLKIIYEENNIKQEDLNKRLQIALTSIPIIAGIENSTNKGNIFLVPILSSFFIRILQIHFHF